MKRPDQEHEEHVARVLGGRVQPASGAGPLHKLDVKTDHELVSCKCTTSASTTLKLADWWEVQSEAQMLGLEPMMAYRYHILNSRQHVDMVAITMDRYIELRGF